MPKSRGKCSGDDIDGPRVRGTTISAVCLQDRSLRRAGLRIVVQGCTNGISEATAIMTGEERAAPEGLAHSGKTATCPDHAVGGGWCGRLGDWARGWLHRRNGIEMAQADKRLHAQTGESARRRSLYLIDDERGESRPMPRWSRRSGPRTRHLAAFTGRRAFMSILRPKAFALVASASSG
jgi:hypothetical protein